MTVVSGYAYDGCSDEIYLVVICPSCRKLTRINDFEDDCRHCERELVIDITVKTKYIIETINVMGETDNGQQTTSQAC